MKAHPAPPRPSRGRPPIPGLRERILRAAEATFTRRDFHEVQMDDIARSSGVGKGTLYRYFPSKRDLYLAVTFDGVERLREELEAVVRTPEASPQKIARIVRCTLGYFWGRHRFFALIHQQEHKPDADVREWFRQRGELVHLVQGALDRAIAAGDLRRVDSRMATEMLFGMMRSANRYHTAADDLESLVGTVVDLFLRGVASPGPGERATRPRGGRS